MRRVVLAVRDVEDALDVLLPRLPDGVEERDGGVLVAHARTAELPPGDELAALAQAELVADLDVPDDWRERRRADGLGGVVAADRFWLRSPLDPPAADGLIDIVIDRSGAFGTGAHPTTRMCLELMLSIDPGGPFADLGCGGGALAIAAAKLGYAPVAAVDYDEPSVEAARANIAANGVDVRAEVVDLTERPPPPGRIFAANMPDHVHAALRVTDETEVIIASGIRSEDDVDYPGWTRERVMEGGGWVAIKLVRP